MFTVPPGAPLSELTRRVLHGAGQLAEQFRHPHIGLAHVLLALAREPRSICAELLRQHGLDGEALAAKLAITRRATGGELRGTLDNAIHCAGSFGSHYVGTDHLLMILVSDPRGARLLRRYGVALDELAHALHEHLSRNRKP